jgi:hypothetical protein
MTAAIERITSRRNRRQENFNPMPLFLPRLWTFSAFHRAIGLTVPSRGWAAYLPSNADAAEVNVAQCDALARLGLLLSIIGSVLCMPPLSLETATRLQTVSDTSQPGWKITPKRSNRATEHRDERNWMGFAMLSTLLRICCVDRGEIINAECYARSEAAQFGRCIWNAAPNR